MKIRRPNFLIIMVDEQRFPPPYEIESIKAWRREKLHAQNFLLKNGVEFLNHYAASTACAPSRASMYTGQYPSLHGVTQTDGGGSTASMPDIFWLDPNTVPTFGDYLRIGGYKTFWRGKWHVSHSDITIPGTHNSLPSYDPNTGIPDSETEAYYAQANKLDDYGFDGWIGPEPHGSNPRNSGSSASTGVSGRDEVYSDQVIKLLKSLENEQQDCKADYPPWAIVASFVNPHDIALFGAITRLLPQFSFDIDKSVPSIPPSPTALENLNTKPKVQASYKEIYPQLIQPLFDTEVYRRFYYSLQLKVDQEIFKVLNQLNNSPLYNDTIIIYTSDHGDLLGSHGGLFQKWYQAYEEAIHVPFIVHNPKLVPQAKSVTTLTSHVDLLPTLIELSDINVDEAIEKLKKDHTEVHKPVGRSLMPLIANHDESKLDRDVIYFMTDDDPSKSLNTASFTGRTTSPVAQPSHIETIITKLPTGTSNEMEIWKYSRYFDNPQFWSSPGSEDQFQRSEGNVPIDDNTDVGVCITTTKTQAVPDEVEMYNISKDHVESQNLAKSQIATEKTKVIQKVLAGILEKQCKLKRIYPSSGSVPGSPNCKKSSRDVLNL